MERSDRVIVGPFYYIFQICIDLGENLLYQRFVKVLLDFGKSMLYNS